MLKVKENSTFANATAATVGYEAELWQLADVLQGGVDAADYKHVGLGLTFLKPLQTLRIWLEHSFIPPYKS